eukprot:6460053-Pyramimonas_sp.AAC.1
MEAYPCVGVGANLPASNCERLPPPSSCGGVSDSWPSGRAAAHHFLQGRIAARWGPPAWAAEGCAREPRE